MKYVRHLEDVIFETLHFPYKDLEIDYVEEDGQTQVLLFYTDTDQHTKSVHLETMPSSDFPEWAYSLRASRAIKSAIQQLRSKK